MNFFFFFFLKRPHVWVPMRLFEAAIILASMFMRMNAIFSPTWSIKNDALLALSSLFDNLKVFFGIFETMWRHFEIYFTSSLIGTSWLPLNFILAYEYVTIATFPNCIAWWCSHVIDLLSVFVVLHFAIVQYILNIDVKYNEQNFLI